jgi:hypothetical protein
MKAIILKRILKGLLALFLLFCLLMVTPRTIGFLFPEKPPVGYHFENLSLLALGTGLEKLADLEPEIPETIEEIKDVEYKNVNGKSLQMDFYRPKNVRRIVAAFAVYSRGRVEEWQTFRLSGLPDQFCRKRVHDGYGFIPPAARQHLSGSGGRCD